MIKMELTEIQIRTIKELGLYLWRLLFATATAQMQEKLESRKDCSGKLVTPGRQTYRL